MTFNPYITPILLLVASNAFMTYALSLIHI